ncbi:MAG: MFS transporter [Myxococcota bacterium]|nr:MFS transporter [Myxococcota bacterium]
MSDPGPARAPADHQVPLGIRLAYGTGSVADGAKNAAFNAFLVIYYTTVLGLPGTLSGLAIFLALCVDAVTDPLVGSISDNFRSRWGRRHPFMFFAAIPMGVCFYALFAPPEGLSEGGLFAWLLTFAIGVRLFLTFYMVPSNAMGPEMTTHYDERTTLASFRWLLGWTGAIVITSTGWLVFLADRAEQVGEGRLAAQNYPALGLFVGVVVASAILVSSFGTRSLIPRLRPPVHDGPIFSLPRFLREVRLALHSHSLRVLLASSLFAATAIGIEEVLRTYMGTWFWEFHSEQLGLLAVLQVIPIVIGVALARPVSEALDKRRATIRLTLFAILWGPLPVLLRLAGLAPENGDPMLLLMIMAHGGFLIATVIQIGILHSSMIMDAIDENELHTGERQEGVFVAAIAFTGKAVSGFGNFLGGVVLDVIDFPTGAVDAAVGQVPTDTIVRLGLVAGPGLVVFHLAALWFVSRLRLTRARYGEIVAALDERRAARAGR